VNSYGSRRCVRDVRYAARTLARSPGLVIVTVLCLGLGIGVNATIFNLFNAAVLQEPTAREPQRLVRIEPGNSDQISYLNYRDLLGTAGFDDIAISGSASLNLRNGQEIEPLTALQVSGNFFDLLGVGALTGRTFNQEESVPERRPLVIVLDHRFWQRKFGGDANVLGRTLDLNGEIFMIIGVLGPGHRPGMGFFRPDAYVPISAVVSPAFQDRRRQAFELRARLAPGVTRTQAQAAFTSAAQALEAAYPEVNQGFGEPAAVLSVSGLALLQGRGVPPELMIGTVLPFAIFGLLLLVACANVAGLLLARAADRRREIAIRLAIGASRGSVVQMLLVETLMLSIIGTAGGLLLTVWLTGLLTTVQLPNAAGLHLPGVQLDLRLTLYALAVAIFTALFCGLAPALQATRVNLTPGLKEQSSGSRRRGGGLRGVLVAGQVFASVLLLTMCLLFLRSLQNVGTVDPGFDIEHGITARVALDQHRFTEEQRGLFAERAVERLGALPGITSASFASLIPLGGDSVGASRQRQLKDRPDWSSPEVLFADVGPRYFETMGIAVRRGREFLSGDRRGAPSVAIVNETYARLAFPAEDALGRSVRGRDDEPWSEIVGVVADNKYTFLSEPPAPQMFFPFLQRGGSLFLQVRTSGSPARDSAAVKRTIADLDKTVVVSVQSTKDATSLEFTLRRSATGLLAALGTLGLLLAMIGLFGVLAWEVSRRTREIGIRVALGASPGAVRRLVVRDAMWLVAAGTIAGLAAAVLLALPLRDVLAGASPADPVVLTGVPGVLLLVTLVASWIPARRASAVDAVMALRGE
jgi:putative ABC transport system permease protein